MKVNKIVTFLLFIASHTAFAESLYHIIDKNDWAHVSTEREYKPASLAKDGFIHLSSKKQVVETAEIFFKGKHNLLLLKVDIPSNNRKLKWESALGGTSTRKQLFPHYYAPLPLNYVTAVYRFEPNRNGTFSLPANAVEK